MNDRLSTIFKRLDNEAIVVIKRWELLDVLGYVNFSSVFVDILKSEWNKFSSTENNIEIKEVSTDNNKVFILIKPSQVNDL